jgi:hypothetical protein
VVAGLAAPWPVKSVVDNVRTGRVSAPFGFAGSREVVLVAVAAGVGLVGVLFDPVGSQAPRGGDSHGQDPPRVLPPRP